MSVNIVLSEPIPSSGSPCGATDKVYIPNPAFPRTRCFQYLPNTQTLYDVLLQSLEGVASVQSWNNKGSVKQGERYHRELSYGLWLPREPLWRANRRRCLIHFSTPLLLTLGRPLHPPPQSGPRYCLRPLGVFLIVFFGGFLTLESTSTSRYVMSSEGARLVGEGVKLLPPVSISYCIYSEGNH